MPPREYLRQILPFDIFLGDVVHAVDAADLVNLHDVGVHQRRGGLRFHVEAAHVSLDRRPVPA